MKGKLGQPIALVFLTLITLAAGSGLGYWQYGSAQEAQSKVDGLRAELGSKADLESTALESKAKLEQGLNDLTHLESTLSTLEYVPTLLKDLQKTGESSNLQIVGVRPVPKTDTKKKKPGGKEDAPSATPRRSYVELDVEVKCRGSFANIMGFLKKLEQFPKIVGVRNVSIDPKVGTDGKTLQALETTLRIRVYVFPSAAMPPGQGATTAAAQAPAGGTS